MAKGKKARQPKGKKITLKMAKSCLQLTLDGKRRLDLSKKEITAVPKCILQLCDVDELDLSRNLIKKLPDFIDRFANLHLLDLHSNQLEQLPQTIGRLQNLLTLNLSHNRLTAASLPSELGLLGKLQNLNLGLNQLETLPASIGALRELRHVGLFDNRLTRYPACLQRLKSLERVNLDGNPILTEQPADLDPIRRVETLHLVKESSLCADCVSKFQTERRRLEEMAKAEPVKSKLLLAGLIPPRSDDQETWR
ncbi:leucine-rich repeat-containing protein 18 [Myripristis murdjan]|uniref:Leucine rich repeat containing 18 n=1 Tax=Myripristis murdjan TaxID=586833 RepID=A0A667Y3G2_9TELE|nr:leucine-rich repeat-containing protein 18-like [Myripristis murdjan]